MAVKFFGQYLLERGLVSREKLLEAIELQKTTNLKFGEMALEMGFLREAGIERVHQAQRAEDLRFGDVALRLGLMSEAQVEQVLTRQENSYLYIGKALLEVGALSEEQLEKHLEDFRQDQAPFVLDAVTVPTGVPGAQVWEVLADLTYKMLTRIASLPYKASPCRTIDRLEGNAVIAAMELHGSVSAKYLFSASEGVQKAIARTMWREDEVEEGPQEILDDSVMEYVNIVCGNAAGKAAQLGFKVQIAPPEVYHPGEEGISVPPGQIGLLFPIHVVNDERVEMALFVEP